MVLSTTRTASVERPDPRSVRISVTDRCDLACTYCRPSRADGYVEGRLSLGEWEHLVDGLIASGVRRFRLTGGEPLLYAGLVDLCSMIASRGVQDLALTTNATRLARFAQPLKDAGLMRINVSIDSLREDRFRTMTRGGDLKAVLDGLFAAQRVGFAPIKLNAVVVRGSNDDELVDLVRFAWQHDFVPRFLEVMKIGEGAAMLDAAPSSLVTVREMRGRLASLLVEDAPSLEPDRGPAKYVASRTSAAHRVGFISGTSDTYCAACDRLRVSSSGVLRPCLATEAGVATKDPTGVLGDVPALVKQAWAEKPDGALFKGCTEPSASKMSIRAIGG